MLPEAVRQKQHHLIQPLESAWQKAQSALRQVSTAPPSPPEPKQSLASSLLEPASWYQTRHTVNIANADMELPTHRKLRPHS